MYIEKSMNLLLREPKLETRIACRNLWNLFSLDYKSPEALAKFSNMIL
jgi:hypothetical protein